MSEVTIAARIKMARKMADMNTQAALLKAIPEWSASRLGNYEAGISLPGADDILKIAKATDSSPCWLMFGLGPIRSNHRDRQAIRHQNLCNTYMTCKDKRGGTARLARALDISKTILLQHVDNPFLPISSDMARKFESFINTPHGWMNEQHVEHDPLCLSFPEDIRELMALYSGLPPKKRVILLETVRTLSQQLQP